MSVVSVTLEHDRAWDAQQAVTEAIKAIAEAIVGDGCADDHEDVRRVQEEAMTITSLNGLSLQLSEHRGDYRGPVTVGEEESVMADLASRLQARAVTLSRCGADERAEAVGCTIVARQIARAIGTLDAEPDLDVPVVLARDERCLPSEFIRAASSEYADVLGREGLASVTVAGLGALVLAAVSCPSDRSVSVTAAPHVLAPVLVRAHTAALEDIQRLATEEDAEGARRACWRAEAFARMRVDLDGRTGPDERPLDELRDVAA